MAKEIERKFLLRAAGDFQVLRLEALLREKKVKGRNLRQGYLAQDAETRVTARVRASSEKGWLTIKGKSEGATRDEFEYEVPLADAQAMLALTPYTLQKVRYCVPHFGHVFEVDFFSDATNAGLVLAEVELHSETERVRLPKWIGQEVTGDPRYYNSRLAGLL